MKVWRIEARGEAREIYSVRAETKEQAVDLWVDGESENCVCVVSEVTGSEIESIEEEDDD